VIITVAGFKGGVGKTTSAVHLAAYLNTKAPTLLVDGDQNRSALRWHQRGVNEGRGLPFQVIDERQLARYARDFEHIVIDTQARPEEADLKELIEACDLLILPTTPDALALDALSQTVMMVKKLGGEKYRVLLTMVPPRPSKDGAEARAGLKEQGFQLLKTEIPRGAAVGKASLAGVLVSAVRNDPRASVLWDCYKAMGKEAYEQVRKSANS
jgi:chromosome partitioning protein